MQTIKKLLFTLFTLICASSNPMVHASTQSDPQQAQTKSHIKKIAFVGGTTISISIACFILYIINSKNTNSSQPIQPEKESKEDTEAKRGKNHISSLEPHESKLGKTLEDKIENWYELVKKADQVKIPEGDTVIALSWPDFEYSFNREENLKLSKTLFKDLKKHKTVSKNETISSLSHLDAGKYDRYDSYKWHEFNILAVEQYSDMRQTQIDFFTNLLARKINKVKGIIFFVTKLDIEIDNIGYYLNLIPKIMKEGLTIHDILFLPHHVKGKEKDFGVKQINRQIKEDCKKRYNNHSYTQEMQDLYRQLEKSLENYENSDTPITEQFYTKIKENKDIKTLPFMLPKNSYAEIVDTFDQFAGDKLLPAYKTNKITERHKEQYKKLLTLSEKSGITTKNIEAIKVLVSP